MGKKLEVLRAFCLSPGKDVSPGDELDEAEVGEKRADLLCSGSVPKCRRIAESAPEGGEPGAGGDPADGGPKPKTKAEKAAGKKAAAKKRVPGKLRQR